MVDLDEFLRRGGTDLRSVVANVELIVGLHADDELLAVGSLVEGLGSSKSDLDLLLITPREDRLLPPHDHIALVVGNCLMDVLILQSSHVNELFTRFDVWARAPWNVTHATKSTLAERTLLHRLSNAKVLFQTPEKDYVTVRKPTRRDLARLKLHVARQNARTVQVDMVGYRDEADYRSLAFAAQELLGDAVDALLAGYELTNPLSKWRSRLLDSVPGDWEASLLIRPTGLMASQVVWQLHRAPEQPDEDECLNHALRITTFARKVFTWAELRLLKGSGLEDRPTCWPQVERQAGKPPLPWLDFDVDFLFVDGQVIVGRLNDFSTHTLTLTPREFTLFLLFDGTTTARDAEVAVYGFNTDEAGTCNADNLAARLAVANLSVKTHAKEDARTFSSTG